MGDNRDTDNKDSIDRLRLRDEILQVIYWMEGEGLGVQFSVADLQKFLQDEETALTEALRQLAAAGLVMKSQDDRYALTERGRVEGGRRFADEFEDMMKPGHYECDEPDCDCHAAGSMGECKNLSPGHSAGVH